jgi:hypothetical protein
LKFVFSGDFSEHPGEPVNFLIGRAWAAGDDTERVSPQFFRAFCRSQKFFAACNNRFSARNVAGRLGAKPTIFTTTSRPGRGDGTEGNFRAKASDTDLIGPVKQVVSQVRRYLHQIQGLIAIQRFSVEDCLG